MKQKISFLLKTCSFHLQTAIFFV